MRECQYFFLVKNEKDYDERKENEQRRYQRDAIETVERQQVGQKIAPLAAFIFQAFINAGRSR